MNKYKNIKTITLGCRFNFYESEVSKAIVKALDPKDDVIIVNTCAVTKQAENQSKQAVRRAIRESTGAKIIVTGCALTTCKEYFQSLDGVYSVIDNDKKNKISAYTLLPHNASESELALNFTTFGSNDKLFHNRVKVFLQIQTGCNNFCSYCIVPFARGRSKSLSLSVILDRVKYFCNSGFKEIVLSGIDITAYGKDLGDIELADVINAILREAPNLERIRISSMNPHGITNRLFNLITKEPRVLPHLHLSIQSGNDEVLHSMRRKYNSKELLDIIQRLKTARPELVIGADVIAGYPTETEDQFESTMNFIENSGISLFHVFPFSPRPGTIASKLLQLPKHVILKRAAVLRQLASKLKLNLMKSFIGTTINGLIEKNSENTSFGKTDNYLDFIVKQHVSVNTILYDMLVIDIQDDKLLCQCNT